VIFAERSGAQRKGADVDPAQCILTKIDGGFSQHGFALRNAETGIGGVGQGWILRIANADTVGARDGHAENATKLNRGGPRNACSRPARYDSAKFTAVNGQEDTGPRSLPARASAR